MKYISVIFSTFLLLFFPSLVFAFNPADSSRYGGLAVRDSIGAISNVDDILVIVAKLLIYVGWAGTIIGILAVLGLLIFKLVGTDSTEVLKEVQAGIMKALVIALFGLLILSAGFFLTLATDITGQDAELYSGSTSGISSTLAAYTPL